MIIKKRNYYVIFGRDLLQELGIQLDFQNNFIGWQENWSVECQKVFDTIKKLVSRENLLSYPNFNKPFEIHTDTSKQQFGSVISQKGKCIVFYSRKLNPAQINYTTTERKLLSIVETLKEFRTIGATNQHVYRP